MIYSTTNKEVYIGFHDIDVYKIDDPSINFHLYIDQYFVSVENNAILFYRYDEPVACIDLSVFDWQVTHD